MIKIKSTSFTRVGYINCVVLPRIKFLLFVQVGRKNPISFTWNLSHNKSQSLHRRHQNKVYKYDEVGKYKQINV